MKLTSDLSISGIRPRFHGIQGSDPPGSDRQMCPPFWPKAEVANWRAHFEITEKTEDSSF